MINIKEIIRLNRKKIIVGGLVLVLATGGVVVSTQIPPSAEEMLQTYIEMEEYKEGYGSYYLSQFSSKGIFGKIKRKRLDEMTLLLESNLQVREEEGDALRIDIVEINSRGLNSNYRDIDITFTNTGSRDLEYVKFNIFYKDSQGNIVKSEWTNDSATVKPGASQVVSKMTEKSSTWDNVSVELAEVRYK